MSTKTTDYGRTRTSPAEGAPVAGLDDASAPELNARLHELYTSGKTQVAEWRGGLQEGIRGHPVRSLLIAGALGAVVGLLLARRS